MDKHRILEGLATSFLNRSTNRGEREKPRKQKKLNNENFPSEVWFEQMLNENGFHDFEKNAPCGIYFIDFLFKDKSIAIEIDGKSHSNATQAFKDKIKDSYMIKHKLKVFRINAYDENRAKDVLNYLSTAKINSWAGYTIPQKPTPIKPPMKHGAWMASLTPEEKTRYRQMARKTTKDHARGYIERRRLANKKKESVHLANRAADEDDQTSE